MRGRRRDREPLTCHFKHGLSLRGRCQRRTWLPQRFCVLAQAAAALLAPDLRVRQRRSQLPSHWLHGEAKLLRQPQLERQPCLLHMQLRPFRHLRRQGCLLCVIVGGYQTLHEPGGSVHRSHSLPDGFAPGRGGRRDQRFDPLGRHVRANRHRDPDRRLSSGGQSHYGLLHAVGESSSPVAGAKARLRFLGRISHRVERGPPARRSRAGPAHRRAKDKNGSDSDTMLCACAPQFVLPSSRSA